MPVFLSKTSLKYLKKLDKSTGSKIVAAIEGLPGKGDIRKMRGPGPPNLYRLRVGKHRVLYIWQEDIIRVIDIDTRGDIYK